ncbi:MAG: TolB family protein [Planctomycetota bacterium JB042]
MDPLGPIGLVRARTPPSPRLLLALAFAAVLGVVPSPTASAAVVLDPEVFLTPEAGYSIEIEETAGEPLLSLPNGTLGANALIQQACHTGVYRFHFSKNGFDVSARLFVYDHAPLFGVLYLTPDELALWDADQAPVVSAGDDEVVELPAGSSQVAYTLQGAATDPDPDGSVTLYEWTGSPVDPADVANPQVLLGVGVHTFELRAYDDLYKSASDTVTVTVVDDQPGVTVGPEWGNWGFSPTAETVIANVSVSPNGGSIYGILAISEGAMGSGTVPAVVLRFSPAGVVEALDGATYHAVDTLSYTAGETYDFRIVVDVPSFTYDAYVTPKDQTPVEIANGYAFNPASAPLSQVDNLGLLATKGTYQGLLFSPEFHSGYEKVSVKTVYAWKPDQTVHTLTPTPHEGWYGAACIHPDGDDVIFPGAAWGYSRIWRYSFGTGKVVPLTSDSSVSALPSYSADGSSIVYVSDADLDNPRFDMFEVGRTLPHDAGFKGGITAGSNLYVMDADGQNVTRITSGEHVDSRPSFSPDGGTVVFHSDRGGANTLFMWKVPSDGSAAPTKVPLDGDPWVGRPRYSLDGSEIFFFTGVSNGQYDPVGRHTLCRVAAGGGAWSPLPNDTVGDGSHGPDPDPAGADLWYHAIDGGLWGIYRLPLSGVGNPVQFVPPGFGLFHVAHATAASNGFVGFDSRTYLSLP